MSATYEGMSPGGHETYATSIFSKIKTYLDSNPYGYVSKSGDTMTGNLTAPKFIGALQGNASTASKLGSSNVGSATQPIYLNGGTATACTYTLGKSVPSNAVFTDHYAWTDITGKPSTFTPSTHYHTQINDRGNVTAEVEANRPAVAGLSMVRAYNNGYPATYGNVITLNGLGCGEIFIGWSGSSGQHAPCYVRSKRDTSNASWSGWSKIFTASYPPTAVECGALPTTGGTVSGDTIFSKKVQVSGIFKCGVISRYDNNDSGYVNHVNLENNAYRPVRASAFTNMSCKYTKENIVDISEEDALKLLDIRPVNFDYIEEVGGLKNQIGVLAEDTYEILPKVVSVPDDYVEEDFDISKGIHQPLPSVDYAKFVPYLIKLVQIQQKEIDILKKERT